MRFISVPRRAKYVVKPTTRTMNALGMPEVHKGLQARFINHTFDSKLAQGQNAWTDEEREAVERYLLAHRDYERHNGYYLDEVVEGKGEVSKKIDLPMTAVSTRCIAFFRNEDGEVEQCPREAQVGDFCSTHAEEEAKV